MEKGGGGGGDWIEGGRRKLGISEARNAVSDRIKRRLYRGRMKQSGYQPDIQTNKDTGIHCGAKTKREDKSRGRKGRKGETGWSRRPVNKG